MAKENSRRDKNYQPKNLKTLNYLVLLKKKVLGTQRQKKQVFRLNLIVSGEMKL